MASRGRPPKKIEEWPFNPPPLGEAGATHTLNGDLVEVLVNAGGGILAHALARARWPFLWDGPSEHWTPDQREAQDEAPREAVELWLKIHARGLTWKLELYGARSNNRRDDMKAARKAHESAACHMRCWIDNPTDVTLTDRAAAAVDALRPARGISSHRPLPFVWDEVTGLKIHTAAALARSEVAGVPDWIKSSAEDFECAARDIDEWLKGNSAKGGANLASREVARLVSQFFDDARKVTIEKGIPLEEIPRVAFADSDAHDPRNSYCKTVKSTLELFGLPPGNWRYAAKFICAKRKS